MPAVVKRTEGSSGTSEEEGTIVCPLSSKNFRNFSRISLEFISKMHNNNKNTPAPY